MPGLLEAHVARCKQHRVSITRYVAVTERRFLDVRVMGEGYMLLMMSMRKAIARSHDLSV